MWQGSGDDIPMVRAWKQDHCSWTRRSVQTYTHATLRPTLCSALPWWHNPKFYCQCEYKSVCRCLWIVGWVNMTVKAPEREKECACVRELAFIGSPRVEMDIALVLLFSCSILHCCNLGFIFWRTATHPHVHTGTFVRQKQSWSQQEIGSYARW